MKDNLLVSSCLSLCVCVYVVFHCYSSLRVRRRGSARLGTPRGSLALPPTVTVRYFFGAVLYTEEIERSLLGTVDYSIAVV